MKLVKVRPDRIKVPETRVTARFDPEMWEMFQSSVKEAGVVAPIICCEIEGELVLVDGLHRLAEAMRNRVPQLDVAIIEGTMVDVLTKNLFLDHMRGKTPVSEMVKVIGSLWKEFQLSSEQIAAKTGMTRDYVEKLQKISELTPAARESLDEGRIGVGHAAALTKISDPIRQETVLRQQELYRWQVKELEAFIKDVLEMVEAQAEAHEVAEERPPIKLKCYYCRGEYDPSEISNPNTCIECAGALITAIAQARAEAEAEARAKKEEQRAPE